jgi:hypothetical protein
MVAVDAPNMNDRLAAVRGHDSTPPVDRNAFTERPSTLGEDLTTNPIAKPLSAEELFGIEAEDALSRVSAEMDIASTHSSMPAMRDEPVVSTVPTVPVVRFSKSHSIQPPNTSSTSTTPSQAFPVATAIDNARVPTTKPGIAPVSASAAPHLREPRRSKPPSNIQIGQAMVERAKPRRTWLYVLGGIVLAGGTAAGVNVLLTQSNGGTAMADQQQPTADIAATPAPAAKLTGTIKFVIEPADSEIKIDKDTHSGSPFTSELAAGIHQIEIRKAGYKSWLTSLELSQNEMQTLRVVLEPLAATPDSNATLTVATTPAGLDVFIDGKPFKDKTPIKTTLPVGSHTIAVKQNGVEVWKQTINAEASSDYEFNPSFTDDKKRERLQRPPAKAPAPAPAPAAPATKPAEVPAAASTPAPTHAPTETTPPTGAQPPATSLSPATPPMMPPAQ